MRGGTTKAERVLRDLQQHAEEFRATMKEDEMDDLKRELQSLTAPQLEAWAREAGIPKGERAGKDEKALVKMIVTAEEGKANKARKREAKMMREWREWREARLSGAKPSLDNKSDKQRGEDDENKAVNSDSDKKSGGGITLNL